MLHKSFTPFPLLKTQRLTLRQLVMNDDNEIFTLRSDNEINKYLDRDPCTSIGEARDFIEKVNENIKKNNSLYWTITFKDKNILVGTICLFSFSEDKEQCEMGYELLTGYQGQGIMKEAAESVMIYAFEIIQVKKIEAVSHKDNHNSIKLLEKLAFKNSNETDITNPELKVYSLTKMTSK